MREIKFRAWEPSSQIMYKQVMAGGFPSNPTIWTGKKWVEASPEASIMQFTGLKDKNGVEIYEGDILMGDNKNAPLTPVVWDSLSAAFNVFYNIRAEIVGNIYENQELLK